MRLAFPAPGQALPFRHLQGVSPEVTASGHAPVTRSATKDLPAKVELRSDGGPLPTLPLQLPGRILVRQVRVVTPTCLFGTGIELEKYYR